MEDASEPFTFNAKGKAMDEDGMISLGVFASVLMCTITVVVGAIVCPQTRPRRVSGYIADDESLV